MCGLGGASADAAVARSTDASTSARWGARSVSAVLGSGARGPVSLGTTDRVILRALPNDARVALHAQTGRVRFLAGSARRPLATAASLRLPLAAPGSARTAASGPAFAAGATVTIARAFLHATAPLFGISGANSDLAVERTRTLGSGRSFVRFQQLRDGLPVLGGELIVQLDRRGSIISTSGEALPAADRLVTGPRIPTAAARAAAADLVARDAGTAQGAATTQLEGLAILDPRLMGGGGPPVPRLVWQVDARAETTTASQPSHDLVFVDALNGAVLDSVSRVENAQTRHICNDHQVRQKDIHCVAPYARDEGGPATSDAEVDKVYNAMGATYDFYMTRFGRDSLDGAGEPMVATVHYCELFECPLQNAFWEWGPQQTAFGNGWASADDIVAHEFTHGVQDHEDRLFYHYQSGAINESFADIFGEFVDLTDGIGNDTAGVRWLIGEDMPIGAIRSMSNPPAFGDPDRVGSPRWAAGSTDNGGVHVNSSIGNKAAFLITDGGRFNGHTVRGLGLYRAEAIEYETMTNLLTSAADYNDLFDALQQACLDLVGTQGIHYADCHSVHEAVAATEMDRLPRAEKPRLAPVCGSGRYPVTTFADDFEDTSRGAWASQTIHGTHDAWFYPQNPNDSIKWDGTWASSGTTNLFGEDQPMVSDSAMAMTAPVKLPPGALLRFEQGFRFDVGSTARFDGGVVELSVDGGRWRDAGRYFRSQGYNGRVARHHGNPLSGRLAFTGDSFGWGASLLDLSSLAGHNVRVRFRIGSDRSTGSYGWYIDDLRIYRCAFDHTPPTGTLTLAGGAGTIHHPAVNVTLTGADGGSGVSWMLISNSAVLQHGKLRYALVMPWATTIPGWLLTDKQWGGHGGNGVHHVYAQIEDAAGNWSAVISDDIVLDTTPPPTP
jgi:bacillolysin